jgi:hypothetical protein
MQPTTRQKMAKTIPTTKPTRKPENNTKHKRGDENDLKLTGPKNNRPLNIMLYLVVIPVNIRNRRKPRHERLYMLDLEAYKRMKSSVER